MFELMRYVSKQVVKRQGRMGRSGATCVHIILEIRVVSLVTVLLFTTIMHGNHVVHCSSNVATTPPRGWNSYDAFSWIISEEVFLKNARVVAEKLIPFGYEYVVVDFLWYRENDGTASTTRGKDFVDKYGRPQPDPQRWPSSRNGQGFKHVADKVHNMGLKFGIHVMRGISLAAVDKNTLILNAKGSPDASGRSWTARDIALQGEECAWMRNSFTRVNLSCSGGQAFIESLYQQYADWGVDLVKHDCIFGSDLVLDEVTAVSQVIANTGRPIVYSLSPGVGATPAMALQVAHLANMYRVSRDNWDSWNSLQPHFDIARDFAYAGLVGVNQAQGGRSWPDLDMLPFGFLTNPDDSRSVDRPCDLTVDEQQTEMTLWAIAKSPLMFGGDLRYLDDTTFALLTNVLVLQMNAHSTGNTQGSGLLLFSI
ncbi:hypothetical protein BDL97_02G183900 [Sphagnum fallax]|nr:hypothetical protein BDL97_02G183900 [Sphagnum fallax]KAH8972210.1 hypothetical protein BDL97_02G183900 [Sphagnum fallax]